MKKLLTLLCLVLLWAACSAALADVSVAVTPEQPRVGDYVDVVVTPERADPQEILYELLVDGEKSIAYKPENKAEDTKKHLTASFRPRQEGTYTLIVTCVYGKEDSESAEVTLQVAGTAPGQEGPEVVYSQKDGWWYRKWYSKAYKRDLQKSACAIFTLSHALQRMGYTDESVVPEQLAKVYSGYYVEGRGTYNKGLVAKAAEDYDFQTLKDKDELTAKELADLLRRGDMFSFHIVSGHVALLDGISEDGTKAHVVDSAPGATMDPKRNGGAVYCLNEDGTFTQAETPADIPGIRWFFETNEYGGASYWMDLDYCASNRMYLIRMQWLRAETDEGMRGVSVEYAGAAVTKVTRDRKSWRVPTGQLVLGGTTPSAPKAAIVTAQKGTYLKDGNGKRVKGVSVIKRNYMALLLSSEGETYYAYWDGSFGYIDAADVTVLDPLPEGSYKTALIAMNGKTTGGAVATVHLNPQKTSTGLAQWSAGTPVAVLEQQDVWYLVEGKGMRGWVHQKYILFDEPETAGESSTEAKE